jgi:hypothetical protein
MDTNVESRHAQKLELQDCGAISKVTKGDFFQWPWLEIGSPPFIYMCPYCD